MPSLKECLASIPPGCRLRNLESPRKDEAAAAWHLQNLSWDLSDCCLRPAKAAWFTREGRTLLEIAAPNGLTLFREVFE